MTDKNKDYTNISLNEYLQVLEEVQLEERIQKSINEFTSIYNTLKEFDFE